MTEEQREIRRKKRVLEYAERVGNNNIACRRFGIARSTFYVWRDRYRGLRRSRARSPQAPHAQPPELYVVEVFRTRDGFR